jgi:hypothetical protein
MLVKDFSDQATGEMHVTLSSGWGITKGFVPDPLPPNWHWPTELWEVLLEAHKRLAKLDGIGEHLPSAELVLSPLQAREAQKSSGSFIRKTCPQEATPRITLLQRWQVYLNPTSNRLAPV